jgi:hypothetical protein
MSETIFAPVTVRRFTVTAPVTFGRPGPNRVTSATASDGTASLSVASLSVATDVNVVKPAATTLTLNSVKALDPHLRFNMTPGTWLIHLLILANRPFNPVMRWSLSGPAHAVLGVNETVGHYLATGGGGALALGSGLTETAEVIPSTSQGGLNIFALWRTAASGIFGFNWAQGSSNAAGVTVYQGSVLTAKKLA